MKIERLIVGPFQVCCYFVICEDTKEALIIDPGHPEERILELVKSLGILPKALVATHAHPDHIFGVDFLRSSLGIPYMVHQADADFFKDPYNFAPFKNWGFPPNPNPDEVFEEGDLIKFGNCELTVIHTPGHSPGSCCFYSPKEKVVFTGDTLFVGAVGRADLPGGDYFQMMESVINKLLPLPGETIVFPGHDYGETPTSTIEREKRSNPFILEFL